MCIRDPVATTHRPTVNRYDVQSQVLHSQQSHCDTTVVDAADAAAVAAAAVVASCAVLYWRSTRMHPMQTMAMWQDLRDAAVRYDVFVLGVLNVDDFASQSVHDSDCELLAVAAAAAVVAVAMWMRVMQYLTTMRIEAMSPFRATPSRHSLTHLHSSHSDAVVVVVVVAAAAAAIAYDSAVDARVCVCMCVAAYRQD